MNQNEITSKIIGAAIEVHKSLGPGLLEKTYEECLCIELEESGLDYEKQLLPIRYRDKELRDAYRIDLLVEKQVIVELKAVETLANTHKAQLLTYMKLSNKSLGLLINFNVDLLRNGIKRLIL